jgi:hypothetical protein
MAEPKSIEPLRSALSSLLAWFEKTSIKGLVVGGVAASLLGRPRTTQDVDALVLLDDSRWEGFLKAGSRFGFVPRRTNALGFARQYRVLLLLHEPSDVKIDISFGALPFEKEAFKRSIKLRAGSLSIPLPTAEDLIIMKAVAHRPRDIGDIEGVLLLHPKLDYKRIRYWVKEFAKFLGMPEIYDDLENLIKTVPRSPKVKPHRHTRSR